MPAVWLFLALACPAYASDRCDELWGAAMGNAVSSINDLVNAGVDVNCKDTQSSETPLMAAATSGNAESVSALLALHADPNLKNGQGNTALGIAMDHKKAFDGNANMTAMAERFQHVIDVLEPVTDKSSGTGSGGLKVEDADPNVIAKLKFESVNGAIMAGQYDQAVSYLNEVLGLSGLSETNRGKALTLMGQVSFYAQNWQQAKDSCEKVLGISEADTEDQENCKQTLKDLRANKPELFQ